MPQVLNWVPSAENIKRQKVSLLLKYKDRNIVCSCTKFKFSMGTGC